MTDKEYLKIINELDQEAQKLIKASYYIGFDNGKNEALKVAKTDLINSINELKNNYDNDPAGKPRPSIKAIIDIINNYTI